MNKRKIIKKAHAKCLAKAFACFWENSIIAKDAKEREECRQRFAYAVDTLQHHLDEALQIVRTENEQL